MIEYSNCTVAGNGEKCDITSVAGAIDKKIVTNQLKDELVLSTEKPEKNVTKLLDLFKAATGAAFVVVKFEPETGGTCKFAETSVEGSVDVEILNSAKETVILEGENGKKKNLKKKN